MYITLIAPTEFERIADDAVHRYDDLAGDPLVSALTGDELAALRRVLTPADLRLLVLIGAHRVPVSTIAELEGVDRVAVKARYHEVRRRARAALAHRAAGR